METRTAVSQQRQVMVCIGALSDAGPSRVFPLARSVCSEPRFGTLPRVEYVCVPTLFEKELATESAPPDRAVLVVEGKGHLASAVFTTHPPLISLRVQLKAATHCPWRRFSFIPIP
jgi:hypothetical protein